MNIYVVKGSMIDGSYTVIRRQGLQCQKTYPETPPLRGHYPTHSSQVWCHVTNPASLFIIDQTSDGRSPQGKPAYRLASDLLPGNKWRAGIIGSLKRTENRWGTTVSNAVGLSKYMNISSWMPTEVQSLRKKFRHFVSKMCDLNNLRFADGGLQLNLLLVKHRFCLCSTSSSSFSILGMFVSL